jgi:hypothetical protein
MFLKRLFTFLFSFFIAQLSYAQIASNNIAGVWEGKFLTKELDLGQPKLVVEIFNFKEDSLFKGISHLYYKGNFYEHYKIVGMYDKKNQVIVFKEVSTIAVDLGNYGNCLGRYNMAVKKVDANYMFQYGDWTPNIKGCTTNNNVWLKKRITQPITPKVEPKKIEPQKKIVVPQKAEPKTNQIKKNNTPVQVDKATQPTIKETPIVKSTPAIVPPKVAQRETDVQSLIEIAPKDKDSIRIDIYDNGDIDGDIVSVYQDNNLIVNKKTITANALTFYVSLNKKVNPISHLRLVAESLGSIPPCTAVMIVTTKSKRYEVRLSSNFNKNAAVELFLKE